MSLAEDIVSNLETALWGMRAQLATLDISEPDLRTFFAAMRPTWLAQLRAALEQPPRARREKAPDLETLLSTALHSVEGAAARWAALRRAGLKDKALERALANEWGHGGGGLGYEYKGGTKPRFTVVGGKTLTGKPLLERVRKVLKIDQPYVAPPPPRAIVSMEHERHIILALRGEGEATQEARFQTLWFFVEEHRSSPGLVTRVRALRPGEHLVERETVIERPVMEPLDTDTWPGLAPLTDAVNADKKGRRLNRAQRPKSDRSTKLSRGERKTV